MQSALFQFSYHNFALRRFFLWFLSEFGFFQAPIHTPCRLAVGSVAITVLLQQHFILHSPWLLLSLSFSAQTAQCSVSVQSNLILRALGHFFPLPMLSCCLQLVFPFFSFFLLTFNVLGVFLLFFFRSFGEKRNSMLLLLLCVFFEFHPMLFILHYIRWFSSGVFFLFWYHLWIFFQTCNLFFISSSHLLVCDFMRGIYIEKKACVYIRKSLCARVYHWITAIWFSVCTQSNK